MINFELNDHEELNDSYTGIEKNINLNLDLGLEKKLLGGSFKDDLN